jgi:5-methylcytosine-specific restriction endonuclease McrA
MTRRRLTDKERTAMFLAADGCCHICGGRIQAGQAWEVEHRIPIALGGADDETNWSPAHKRCHATKSATDAMLDAIAAAKARLAQLKAAPVDARHKGQRLETPDERVGSKHET